LTELLGVGPAAVRMLPTLWQRLVVRKRKSAKCGVLSSGCLAALLRGLHKLAEICLQPPYPKRAFHPRSLAAPSRSVQPLALNRLPNCKHRSAH
jgi:hypothetical protein